MQDRRNMDDQNRQCKAVDPQDCIYRAVSVLSELPLQSICPHMPIVDRF